MTPRDNESVRELLHDRHPGMRPSQAITEHGQSTVDHALRTDMGADLIASASASDRLDNDHPHNAAEGALCCREPTVVARGAECATMGHTAALHLYEIEQHSL
jgi:hypothetical protein